MSLLENLVVDRAWTKRIREFMQRVQVWNTGSAKRHMAIEERLDEIAADVGFLALLQVATLKLLTDKGILAEGELVPRLAMVDLLDGIEDGSLDPSALRSIIGLTRGGPKAAKAGSAKAAPAKAAAGNGRGRPSPNASGDGATGARKVGGARGTKAAPRAGSKRKKK